MAASNGEEGGQSPNERHNSASGQATCESSEQAAAIFDWQSEEGVTHRGLTFSSGQGAKWMPTMILLAMPRLYAWASEISASKAACG